MIMSKTKDKFEPKHTFVVCVAQNVVRSEKGPNLHRGIVFNDVINIYKNLRLQKQKFFKV